MLTLSNGRKDDRHSVFIELDRSTPGLSNSSQWRISSCCGSWVQSHPEPWSVFSLSACILFIINVLSAMYIAESNLRMLSPSGRCRMWDADADGYGRGEGVGAVVMKTLSAAIEDGDRIECIIRGTGLNQDGRTKGLTMPSGNAQADLIRSTYLRAGLDLNNPADRPQYFHAHGTGTPAGDVCALWYDIR